MGGMKWLGGIFLMVLSSDCKLWRRTGSQQ